MNVGHRKHWIGNKNLSLPERLNTGLTLSYFFITKEARSPVTTCISAAAERHSAAIFCGHHFILQLAFFRKTMTWCNPIGSGPYRCHKHSSLPLLQKWFQHAMIFTPPTPKISLEKTISRLNRNAINWSAGVFGNCWAFFFAHDRWS